MALPADEIAAELAYDETVALMTPGGTGIDVSVRRDARSAGMAESCSVSGLARGDVLSVRGVCGATPAMALCAVCTVRRPASPSPWPTRPWSVSGAVRRRRSGAACVASRSVRSCHLVVSQYPLRFPQYHPVPDFCFVRVIDVRTSCILVDPQRVHGERESPSLRIEHGEKDRDLSFQQGDAVLGCLGWLTGITVALSEFRHACTIPAS